MNRSIPPNGNPEKSVFGLIGGLLGSDDGNLYIKIENDSRNSGWKDIESNESPEPTPPS